MISSKYENLDINKFNTLKKTVWIVKEKKLKLLIETLFKTNKIIVIDKREQFLKIFKNKLKKKLNEPI